VKTNGKADSTITVDAGEGTVIIKAKKITIEATDLIEAKSGKEVKISGTQKIDAGGAQVNIKGSAVVDVKGAVIKLN
jgi:predicted secreted hydrolase